MLPGTMFAPDASRGRAPAPHRLRQYRRCRNCRDVRPACRLATLIRSLAASARQALNTRAHRVGGASHHGHALRRKRANGIVWGLLGPGDGRARRLWRHELRRRACTMLGTSRRAGHHRQRLRPRAQARDRRDFAAQIGQPVGFQQAQHSASTVHVPGATGRGGGAGQRSGATVGTVGRRRRGRATGSWTAPALHGLERQVRPRCLPPVRCNRGLSEAEFEEHPARRPGPLAAAGRRRGRRRGARRRWSTALHRLGRRDPRPSRSAELLVAGPGRAACRRPDRGRAQGLLRRQQRRLHDTRGTADHLCLAVRPTC